MQSFQSQVEELEQPAPPAPDDCHERISARSETRLAPDATGAW